MFEKQWIGFFSLWNVYKFLIGTVILFLDLSIYFGKEFWKSCQMLIQVLRNLPNTQYLYTHHVPFSEVFAE